MSAGFSPSAGGSPVYEKQAETTTQPINRPAQQTPKISSLLESLVAATDEQAPSTRGLDSFFQADTPGQALLAWLQPAPGQKLTKDEIAVALNRDISRLDTMLCDQVNIIIHHPRFQQLEASWRGLRYLVEQTVEDAERRVKIKVLHVPWKELARDMQQASEFDQSQIFKKVYSEEFGTPGGEPYSMLIGDYYARHKPGQGHSVNDLEVIRGMSQVAAASFAPFITSAHPSFFGLDSFTQLALPVNISRTFEQLEYLKWKAFRDSEDARFVGITLPHVLMRQPYQDNDGNSDGFRFREDVENPDRSGYLWGNAAYAFGEVAVRAFVEEGWLADIRGFQRGKLGGGLVAGLPSYSFATDKTGIAPRVSTDGIVSDHQDTELGELGFIPLCPAKDTEFSVFYSNQSSQKPKKYDETAATINARISAMIQYMLCVSRFAHYLKVLGRDKVGSFAEADEVERELHSWLQGYVTSDDSASPEVKAEYPLREASVQVREVPGKPGTYQSIIHLRPHYQLDELTAAVKLITELAPPGR